MGIKISFTPLFEKYFKRYAKKYPSLKTDLEQLEKQLMKNPTLGTNLGGGLYKIRLAVKSKVKGKSGGFRVVSYYIDSLNPNEIKLVILYDKSELGDISKTDIQKIIFNSGSLI
jgi:hypothetical protein